MIKRTIYDHIKEAMKHYSVIVITGARQVGKTTLVEEIRKEYGFEYVDLTDRVERASALNDPSYFIESHGYPLIIDEFQHAPNIIEVIETIVNDKRRVEGDHRCQFIISGSQQFNIMENIKESMAGRAAIFKMEPLSLSEIRGIEEIPFIPTPERLRLKDRPTIDSNDLFDLIIEGFYPELHRSKQNKDLYFSSYLNTYLERDVKQLIDVQNQNVFLRFMQLLASLTAQQLNVNNLSKAIGVDNKTIKKWLSVLESSGIIYLLQPYYEDSLTKAIVKSPKIYFADTGLAAYLARISDGKSLKASIFGGHFMETYVMNEIRKSYINNGKRFNGSYYRDTNGNEIDLVLLENAKLYLVEIKEGIEFNSSAVSSFKQLKASKFDIEHSCLICNTKKTYLIQQSVEAVPVTLI